MALILCPGCDNVISDPSDSCPNCGHRLAPEKISQTEKTAPKMSAKALRRFSEDGVSIGAECPQCGRVLKIYKTNMIQSLDGFDLRQSVRCQCMETYNRIENAQIVNSTPATTLILCPECNKGAPESAERCWNCGFQLATEKISQQKKNKRKIHPVDIIVLLVILGLIVLFSLPNSSSKNESSTLASHEVVENSAWDGSVYQVKSYLKRNLKDPRSFEAIQWSAVTKTSNGDFQVACKYRAKNSFGGYVISCQLFTLDFQGTVINVQDQ